MKSHSASITRCVTTSRPRPCLAPQDAMARLPHTEKVRSERKVMSPAKKIPHIARITLALHPLLLIPCRAVRRQYHALTTMNTPSAGL